MVVVIAVGAPHMEGDASRLGKALQTVGDHLGTEVADLLAAETQVDDGPGTAGEIDHGPRERLIERGIATAKARQGLAGTEGLGESGADREEGVFGRVVVVDYGTHSILDNVTPWKHR